MVAAACTAARLLYRVRARRADAVLHVRCSRAREAALCLRGHAPRCCCCCCVHAARAVAVPDLCSRACARVVLDDDCSRAREAKLCLHGRVLLRWPLQHAQ